jgi:hypothetical protein
MVVRVDRYVARNRAGHAVTSFRSGGDRRTMEVAIRLGEERGMVLSSMNSTNASHASPIQDPNPADTTSVQGPLPHRCARVLPGNGHCIYTSTIDGSRRQSEHRSRPYLSRRKRSEETKGSYKVKLGILSRSLGHRVETIGCAPDGGMMTSRTNRYT